MDFLDPLKRRRHRKRLIISYLLMASVLITGTIGLVYLAYGYGINPRTRQIVRNGLVFLDSRPGGANIWLNGSNKHSGTSARLVLNTGYYQLQLKKPGYRTWQSRFQLKEGAVLRFNHPMLLPAKLKIATVKKYDSKPKLVSPSPDRRWLMVISRQGSGGPARFEVFDSQQPKLSPEVIDLPSRLLSRPSGSTESFEAIQWSKNNISLLVKHTYGRRSEFLVVDRQQPGRSVNVNKRFKIQPSRVVLRDNAADQLYIYSAERRQVQVALTTAGALAKPFLSHVVDFSPLGADQLLYVSDRSRPAGKADVRLWSQGQSYHLADLPRSGRHFIATGEYRGNSYFAVASSRSPWINVYRNPLPSLVKSGLTKLDALVTLKLAAAQRFSFSPQQRFLMVQSGRSLVVYDFEYGNDHHYQLKKPSSSKLSWLDSAHLSGTAAGRLVITDFDGANNHRLAVPAAANGYLSSDYKWLYSLASQPSGSRLIYTSLIPGR